MRFAIGTHFLLLALAVPALGGPQRSCRTDQDCSVEECCMDLGVRKNQIGLILWTTILWMYAWPQVYERLLCSRLESGGTVNEDEVLKDVAIKQGPEAWLCLPYCVSVRNEYVFRTRYVDPDTRLLVEGGSGLLGQCMHDTKQFHNDGPLEGRRGTESISKDRGER
ncbi:hypothetical protein B0H19DRAFT_1064718 [Mycena capillaripes]|nr:hypothetical protein B0H19DRAFT_1064718 [Mycena capillaripes]